MENSIAILTNRIRSVLSGAEPNLVLYGSCVLDDFRPGWSDIDILCLTEDDLSEQQAQTLVGMRQALQAEYPENPFFRAFEGHICSKRAFLHGGNIVYWGTSGQKIKKNCDLDPFSRLLIVQSGRVLCGKDIRMLVKRPDAAELRAAVSAHYQSIREHGSKTGQSLYSAGWILDIARCLYTLRTGGVIGKTQAGEWAIANGCAGDQDVMRRVLEIRRSPLTHRDDPSVLEWLGALGPKVQEYAAVLQRELGL